MTTVTVPSKYQIVIPREIREALGLHPSQKLQVLLFENRIELISLRPIEDMRGFLRGIDTAIERESDRQ